MLKQFSMQIKLTCLKLKQFSMQIKQTIKNLLVVCVPQLFKKKVIFLFYFAKIKTYTLSDLTKKNPQNVIFKTRNETRKLYVIPKRFLKNLFFKRKYG